MKLSLLSAIVLLLTFTMTNAETNVIDSQQVCKERIDRYKQGLNESIKAKQNVDTAKAELDQIDKLPSSLSPCEKQKRIPSLSDDGASNQANEALQDRKVSQ